MKYYCYSMLNIANSFYEVPNPGYMFRHFEDEPETYTSDSMTDNTQRSHGEVTYISAFEPESYFSIIDELPADAELITLDVLCRERPSHL
jgi:hypothetical protein